MTWLDGAALIGSLACMAHCLAVPLPVDAAPVLTMVADIPESFHRCVLLVATPMGAIALASGRARHAAKWPTGLGAVDLTLSGCGAAAAAAGIIETALTIMGSIPVGAAHVGNSQLRSMGAGC